MLAKVEELVKKYGGITVDVHKEYVQWLNNNDELSNGEKAYRYIDDDGRLYQSVSLRAPEYRTNEKFHRPLIHPTTKKACPVPPNGFSRTPETLEEMIRNGEIAFGLDESIQPRQKMFLTMDKQKQLTTVIQNAVKGTSDLNKLGLSFPYCHSVSFYSDLLSCAISKNDDIIFDFFAGSGTTGHAVLEIFRNLNIKAKYILVEMGEYFNTVTKPRMKKVIYSSDWKDGKPQNRNKGISQIMKCIKLESYEDSLSNIKLSEEKHQIAALFGDEYLINYMLEVEAQGSILDIDSFKMPFSYRMKINDNNETKEKVVDLCETFNYLIGLSVVRQSVVSYYKADADKNGVYEGAVKLIEDIDGQFAFKQIEGILPDGRRALIIWRNITDNLIHSNAALDAYFNKYQLNKHKVGFDIIYVNGDNNLENLKTDNEHWKVNMIELEFKQRMFEEV
jgi:adenine-specific DNA-methyltransferase